MVFPRTDPKQITRAFLTDVLAKLPSVCGQKLSLLPQAQYTTGGLLEAAQVGTIFNQFMLTEAKSSPTIYIL